MSLTTAQVNFIQTTFAALAPQADELFIRFYERMFSNHPELRSMFPDDMDEQRKHLAASVALVVKNAGRLDNIVPALQEMGVRHAGYGVKPEQYGVVADNMLGTLSEFAGEAWTDEVEMSWAAALNAVALVMIAGAQGVRKAA